VNHGLVCYIGLCARFETTDAISCVCSRDRGHPGRAHRAKFRQEASDGAQHTGIETGRHELPQCAVMHHEIAGHRYLPPDGLRSVLCLFCQPGLPGHRLDATFCVQSLFSATLHGNLGRLATLSLQDPVCVGFKCATAACCSASVACAACCMLASRGAACRGKTPRGAAHSARCQTSACTFCELLQTSRIPFYVSACSDHLCCLRFTGQHTCDASGPSSGTGS